MSGFADGDAVVVGIGNTEYSRSSGRSEGRLALEAIAAAVADAGLEPNQVDGLVRYGASQTGASEAWVAANLGLERLTFWGAVDFGGSASAALVAHAAAAVASGLANYVVCYRALNGRSNLRPGTSDTYERLLRGADPGYDDFLGPYGFTAPVQTFGLIARRHMIEFGTTPEQLARIALVCRDNAQHNPAAQMFGRPLTMADIDAAPMICDPLRLFDCCLQTDGAAAVLVTTAERARDLAQPGVVISGATQAILPDPQGPLHSVTVRPRLTDSSGIAAAQVLWDQTGLQPDDIDVAQLYDCFTITVLMQLEDYGFCAKGEGGALVDSGAIDAGGRLPINTDGGHLSAGYLHGMNHVLEGVRQMRGTSTRQVPNAQTCLVTGGTPFPTSALVLTREGS